MSGLQAPLDYMPWTPKEAISEVREVIKELEDKVRLLHENVERLRTYDLRDVYSMREIINSMKQDLNDLRKAIATLEERIGRVESLLSLGTSVGLWKSSTCSYKVEDVCTAWKLDEASAERIVNVFGPEAVKVVDGAKRVVVSKVPLLCAFCPLYKPSRPTA
jgi:predicted RNase H-like nuclease (RuvC/YqgF family)